MELSPLRRASSGAMLGGAVAKRYGHAGLPEDTIAVSLTGTGGTLEASVAPGRSGRSGDLVRDADGRPAVPAYSVPVTRTDPDVTEPTGTVTIAGGAVQTTATSVA